jgi:membrane protease YdiL (CAAX protease family)
MRELDEEIKMKFARFSSTSFTMIVIAGLSLLYLLLVSPPDYKDVSIFYLLMLTFGIATMSIKPEYVVGKGMYISYALLGVVLIILIQNAIGLAQLQVLQIVPIFTFAGATAEEVCFRGGLLKLQTQNIVAKPIYLLIICVINAMIFALFHTYVMNILYKGWNITYLLAIWGSGVVLCYLAIITRGLEAPIMAHTIFNIIAYISKGVF